MNKYEWNNINLVPYITTYYNNGNLAIILMDADEPYVVLTKNLESILNPTYAYVDTNNFPDAEEFINKYKLGVYTGSSVVTEFCTYPLYKFDLNKLNEEVKQDA